MGPRTYPCPPLRPHYAPAQTWRVEGGWPRLGLPGAPGGWAVLGPEPTLPSPAVQGLMCVSAKLRLAERRQQRLRDVQTRHELLCEELAETQGRLMVEPGRWLEQCESPLCWLEH